MIVDIALREIQLAQADRDITIAEAGAILHEVARRGMGVDALDLAVAVAGQLGMTGPQRLALVKHAIAG